MSNIFEKLATSSVPVNRTASSVTSTGTSYESPKNTTDEDQPFPFKLTPVPNSLKASPEFVDLTGLKRGRLTVVGYYKREGSTNGKTKARWSCRCDCGTYVLRLAKALKNENNKLDRCKECRHKLNQKEWSYLNMTGRHLPDEEKY